MNNTYIYILKDPRTNEIRYVGKANNPNHRYKNYINKCRDKNTHKRNWINELKRDKLKPILEIIDSVPIDKWKEFEKYYIKKFINDGCNLVNYAEGGEGATFGNKTSFKSGEGAKKVVMLDLDGNYIKTFNKALDACEFIGTRNIFSVLIKRKKTSRGFLFIYEEEYNKMTKEDIKKHVNWATIHKKFSNNGSFKNGHVPLHKIKMTYQYDMNGNFIKEWMSASEAQKFYNLHGGVVSCANGKSKSAGGFFWSYDKIKKEMEK